MESPKRRTSLLRRFFSLREAGTLLVFISICVALAIARPNFRDPGNLLSVTRAFSLVAIMAVGQTMVILTGGIDLSVGSVFGLASCVSGKLALLGLPIGAAYLGAIGVGLLFGAVNGLLVTRARIPSFIATLGTLSIGRTAIYMLTGGWPVSPLPKSFLFSGLYRDINPILYMLVTTAAGAVMLGYSRWGRDIYAVGGNEQAARLSGINVNKSKMIAYVTLGGLAALAGVLNTAVLGVGDPEAGKGYELSVIAASVIGGTSLLGGQGTVLGAFLGAAIMGVIGNGLVLLDVQSDRHPGAIGLVIIAAVIFDSWRRRKSRGGSQE